MAYGTNASNNYCSASVWHGNLANYFTDCFDFSQKANNFLWSHNKNYRKLGDIKSRKIWKSNCTEVMLTKEAKKYQWVGLNDGCEAPQRVNVGVREIRRGSVFERRILCSKKYVKKDKKREWSAEYVPSYVQSFSMDFCDMLSNPVYNTALTMYEKAEMYLNLMWQPTAADTAIMDYAIAKHGTLNFLMATHAMLPSEECFRPWEIKTLMNLPYNWIGNMPPQADVQEVVQFISNFHLLFTRHFDPRGLDPNERRALENQNQNFMEILERICVSSEDAAGRESKEKADERSYEASEDFLLEAYCTPLTWEDQYAATNVKIGYAPNGHEFVYKPPRPIRGVASPIKDIHVLQEGYAHTPAFPDTEVHVEPDFIVSAKSPIARGPYHRHTRAKLRTLAYIKCKIFKEPHQKDEPVNILAPTPADIAYEEMFASLPEHKYGPRGLLEISSKRCLLQNKMKERPFPRWLRRRSSPTTDAPPCMPSRFDVNRRAQLVNTHMKLAKHGLVRCKSPPPSRPPRRAYSIDVSANNAAETTWLRQPTDRIHLPPISRQLSSRGSGCLY